MPQLPDKGCCPTDWKIGQVTPSFKKNDEFDKANYRPVTLLPALIQEAVSHTDDQFLSWDPIGFYQLVRKILEL